MPTVITTTIEEGTEHYKAVEITSVDHANTVLDEKTAAIGEVLKTEGELEFLQFEEIHEVTYSLEAAIDKIRDEKAMDMAKVDSIDEAIQAIHFASENQEEAVVREWFPKLSSCTFDRGSRSGCEACKTRILHDRY